MARRKEWEVKGITVAAALAQSRAVMEAAQRGEPQAALPARRITSVERVRAWRAANPDKVHEANIRAAATRAAQRAAWAAANPDKVREARVQRAAARAAQYAAPPGSVCDVCNTSNDVRLDIRRAGMLCAACHGAVSYTENAERAAAYAVEITRYRAGTVTRQLA